MELKLQKYKTEGDLNQTYSPLQNLVSSETGKHGDFNVKNSESLKLDLNNPLSIECQPSYDGTVNLIINDDKNPPRIINSRFSKLEDNRFKIINRNQQKQTNLYDEENIDQQTRLFRNIEAIPIIDLYNIDNTGELMGGNYTFYVKYADEDYNKTDIVAESGQVCIYKGQVDNIASISGALLKERTDKAVSLKISNLDKSYSKLYIYYTREYSDVEGIRVCEAAMITKPFDIKKAEEIITITGYEEITNISVEDLNIQYNLVSAVKTQAQVQNMLFFGNIKQTNFNIKDLQNLSYYIGVTLKQDKSGNIGWVNPSDYSTNGDNTQNEYYSPNNIYYRLGYWPEEMYRLGVVYIMLDDSLSPVFPLRGCEFKEVGASNINNPALELKTESGNINYLERDSFLDQIDWLSNTFGVFKNPKTEVINYENKTVEPLYYEISICDEVKKELTKLGVKGFFIVRQKRIPTVLCQGFSIGVDATSYSPMLFDGKNYFSESFINRSSLLTTGFADRKITTEKSQCSALLSLDANVIPTTKSSLDGTEFILTPTTSKSLKLSQDPLQSRHFFTDSKDNNSKSTKSLIAHSVFIDEETPLKYANGYSYSTKCGVGEDVSQFSYFGKRDTSKGAFNLLRGLYCPYIGIGGILSDNTIYNVKIPNYSELKLRDYFKIRGNDGSAFYAVSDRFSLNDTNTINVFRGDCYTNTVTIRLNRNFIDSEVPINETIVDPKTWATNYMGFNDMVNGHDKELEKGKGDFASINRADVNTVPLGMWVTFKCLSSYNLGIRSIDTLHVDEYALMGNPRSFYPISDITTNVSHKIAESWILNQGYSATTGRKREFTVPETPYVKDIFDSRIMFSNVQAYGDFQNSFRVFQALDYKDIERQYGAIVKLLPWNNNLLSIFEHGIGVVPINEKALIATQSGQSIHMYGNGVLQDQISLISPDFGTIWPESIIRTPIGVYGVDTYAKKIWRVSSQGIETISDMKIQKFLNENIKLAEEDKYSLIGIKNVKTHYNNFKGDVMFTFYNEDKEACWNLCFNERLNKWITRYSWTPLYSENIDNIFYSLDQNRTKVLAHIYNNLNCTYGIRTINNKFIYTKQEGNQSKFSTDLKLAELTLADKYEVTLDELTTSYLNEHEEEQFITINANDIFRIIKEESGKQKLESLSYDALKMYFNNLGCPYIPAYFNIKLNISLYIKSPDSEEFIESGKLNETVGIVCDFSADETIEWGKISKFFLQNGFYVHGKAGIFNEMSYSDETFNNEILPTKWYDRQESFEFEFVVNDQLGAHKIFDNLVIISNNVQPKEIEFEIDGDVYDFNKAGLFRAATFDEKYLWDPKYNKPIESIDPVTGLKTSYQSAQKFENCKVKWDTNLNSYTLLVNQECKNIEDPEYGRRLGNIQYKEDSWYLTIEPIRFKERFKVGNAEETTFEGREKSTRIRDKYVKIRVKYSGKDLVIITALKTMLTLSYA